ncbi:MAG: ChbG/HpnK family deacetylase [Caldilineaceae bacterium]
MAGESRLDMGVHLTLTSEWAGYRWGPISTRTKHAVCLTRKAISGIAEGVQAHLQPAMALAECAAQIRQVQRAGIDITHLDTHMGAAIIPALVEHYVHLGFQYQVPVLLPRRIDDYVRALGLTSPDEQPWLDFTAAVEAQGMPLVDWFRITPGYHLEGEKGDRAELYETLLHELPAGVTYFSLHPNASGDIEMIVPDRAYWRTFEYEYFQSTRLRDFLVQEGIVPIGYRAIRDIMRRANQQYP